MATSCEKFLEEVSQDEIVPKTVSDYSELLLGEAYIRDNTSINPYLELMTDDVKSYYGKAMLIANDTRETGFGYYTWQEQPEITMSGPVNNDKAWQRYYRSIVVSNIVIDQVDNAVGSSEDKLRLKGEAYLIRAYSYFMLVNLYGKPYRESSAATDLGVPVNPMIYMEDVRLNRETVKTNYDYIVSDLEAGLEAFSKTKSKANIFRWNLTSSQLLASRVFLYMQNYQNAEYYATKVLESNPSLYDLNIKAANSTTLALNFLNSTNPEILFTYGDYYISYFVPAANGCFPASESLMNSYSADDLRFNKTTGAFIRQQGNILGKQYTTFKNGTPSTTQVYGFALRTAEAYLNRAEAFAMQGKVDLAMTDINQLRKFRIKSSAYKELIASDREQAMDIIMKERRLELCYEQHRWFDLRRWNQPRIVHEFVEEYNPFSSKTYVLEANDDAYTLPIPIAVINYQTDMPNNNRPKRQ